MGFWSAVAGSFGKIWIPPVAYMFSDPLRSPTTYVKDPAGFFACRKLDPDYSGQCMRIRRDRDSEETDIGFDGRHLDVQAVHNFCFGDTCYVVKMYDQNSSSFGSVSGPLLQLGTSRQPKIYQNGSVIRSGASNAPALKFDSNDELTTFLESASNDYPRSVSVVTQPITGGSLYVGGGLSSNGERYSIDLSNSGITLSVEGDSINYLDAEYTFGDHTILSVNQSNDSQSAGDLNDSTVFSDGQVLTPQTTASGVLISSNSLKYSIGDGYEGYINEVIHFDDGFKTTKEVFDVVRGNQYKYYQDQPTDALPVVLENSSGVTSISYGRVLYDTSNHEYQTQTIGGFNVPIQLEFTYDDTNCTLYYIQTNSNVFPTASQYSPFSGLTAAPSGTIVTFNYEQNLTLYVDFTTAVADVELTITNITNGNTIINIVDLGTAEYVIPMNVADSALFTRTNGTPLTFNVPFNTSAGDLMLFLVANDEDSEITGPFSEEWTRVNFVTQSNSLSAAAFWRVANGDEFGNSYGFGNTSFSSADWMGWLLKIDNLDTSGNNSTATWLQSSGVETAFGSNENLNGDINVTSAGATELAFVIADGGDMYPFQLSSTDTQNPWNETIPDTRSGFWPTSSGSGISTGWATRNDISTGNSNNISLTSSSNDGVGLIRIAFTPAVSESGSGSAQTPSPSPPPTARVIQTGLFAGYDPADSDSYSGTGTTINDLIGTNTLTINGGMESTYYPLGYFENDGVNDDATGSSVNLPTGDITIAGWAYVKSGAVGTVNTLLFGYFDTFTTPFFLIKYNGGDANAFELAMRWGSSGTAKTVRANKVTPVADRWYYIVGLFDNTAQQGRINVFDSSELQDRTLNRPQIDRSVVGSPAPFLAGRSPWIAPSGVGEWYSYSTLLTDEQIESIYNNTKARYGY